MTTHWKTICFIALLLCASTALAGSGSPPAGTRKKNSGVETRPADTLRHLNTGSDSAKFYFNGHRYVFAMTEDTFQLTKPVLGTSGHFTGALTSDAAVWIPNTGSYTLLGNLLAASNGSWGVLGVTLPYSATTTPTGEGRVLWNSLYNYLTMGDGSATRYLWPISGTATHNYISVFDTNTASTTDNIPEWKKYALVTMPDVDTAGIGDGEVPYYDLASKTIKFQAAGAGTTDSFMVVLTDSTLPESTWVHGGDFWPIDTSYLGDGNDSLLSVGDDRDSFGYTGEAEQLLSVKEAGDTTAVAPGVNTYFKFGGSAVFPNVAYFGNTLYSDGVFGYAGGALYLTAAIGQPTYVGAGVLASADIYFNYGAAAGSAFRFHNSTTETWRIDTDSLIGRGDAYSWIKGCQWGGADIPLGSIAQGGAATGETIYWTGLTWAPTDFATGMWKYSIDTLLQHYEVAGDTVISFTRNTATNTTRIHSDGQMSLEGGTDGNTLINFAPIDTSVYFDSTWCAALYRIFTANGIVDSQIPDNITITRASDADSTGTQIAAALADRASFAHIRDTANALSHHFRVGLSNPAAMYDVDTLVCIVPVLAEAITITRIDVTCNADPTTEPAMALRFANNYIARTTPTTIDVITTTAGVTAITTGFDDATVPAANCIYFVFTADPEAALKSINVDITYTVDN